MKKLASIGLAAVMTAALTISAAALPASRVEITVNKSTPTLDGTITEGEWDTAAAISLDETNSAAWVGKVGTPVSFYYAWDEDGLYIAAHVTDPDVQQAPDIKNVFNKDAFQIALDPNGNLGERGESGGMFFSIGLMEDGTLGAVYHPAGGNAVEFTYTGAGRLTSDGWEFEMMIPWDFIEDNTDSAKYNNSWTHGDGEYMHALIALLDRNADGQNAIKTTLDNVSTTDFTPKNYALKLTLATPAAPETTPATETTTEATTPSTPSAPATADVSVLMAAAAAASAAVAVIVKKKH